MVDVAVVGGGPAGSTVATLLKRQEPQRRIVLFEQARFPRHHVGESTLPDMNPILDKLGALQKIDSAGFVKKTGITYRWRVDRPMFSEVFARGVLKKLGSREVPDHSWQVDRSRYDQILLEHAQEHGVEVIEARVDSVEREGDRVTGVNGMRAGHVVDCSGQARLLSRTLGLAKQAHALGDLAIYRYYRGFRWSPPVGTLDASKIFFSATPSGWIWFIPLSESDVSVGLVTRREFLREGLLDDELATVPEMVSMLDGATPMAAPGTDEVRTFTVADWSYSHAQPCGPGYYLCGDAAAFIDPILSSGILLAHHSGLMVANAILTEWNHSEIAPDELRAGYAQFYSDLYRGFLQMADWWYRRRKVTGIDEWLRRAADLGQSARGAAPLDDVEAFMTFAAGYLCDFRFTHLGIAFGDEGLSQCIDGLEGAGTSSRLVRALDCSRRCRRAFSKATVEPYLATDVDSHRWWRLPALRFDDRLYRPPLCGQDDLVRALRVIERLTEACDGERTLDEVMRLVASSLGREHEEEVLRLANTVLIDSIALGALQ